MRRVTLGTLILVLGIGPAAKAVWAHTRSPDARPRTRAPLLAPTAKPQNMGGRSSATRGVEVLVESDAQEQPLDRASSKLVASPDRAGRRGALALGDYLAGQAALTVTSGNAGLGGAPNKLNLGARGISPRFSSRTQLLWEGMPLALAPYGRPQLTMLPLSLGWMDAMEVDLHGAGANMGPHSIGGQLRLRLHDRSGGHKARVQLRMHHFGRVMVDALLQVGDARQQWAWGYMTLQGRGFREHSRAQVHTGFARWRRRLGRRHRLGLLLFGYGEETQLPGGVTPLAFQNNPRASSRPLDRFVGGRIGGGVFWDALLGPGLWLRTRAVGGLSDRRSEVSTQPAPRAFEAPLRVTPRSFSYVQVESRLRARSDALGGRNQLRGQLEFGVSPTLEWARLRSEDWDPLRSTRWTQRSKDQERIMALALFGQAQLGDAKGRWQLLVGLRSEWVVLSREDQTQSQLGAHRLFALLPSVELRYALLDGLSLFGGYGQTFSPPQFLQIGLAKERAQLAPERGHSAELGLLGAWWKGRLRGQVNGFFKGIRDFADVSAQRLDQPGNLGALGTESQLRLEQRLARGQVRLSLGMAHTWTRGRISGGAFDRLRLPWVSAHRLRSHVGVEFESLAGAYMRANWAYDSAYSTDYRPGFEEDTRGSRGVIPAWHTFGASLGVGRIALGSGLGMQLSLSVHNLLNQLQYTRTPDRNAGRILRSPRRFTFGLTLHHQR